MIYIQVSCRLIEEKELWLLGYCHRQNNFLSFTTAEFIKGMTGESLDAGELHSASCHGVVPFRFPGESPDKGCSSQHYHLSHSKGEGHVEVLRHHGYSPGYFPSGQTFEACSIQQYLSVSRS
ncbi:hypothetical protein ES703_62708 [subsurface metagenome]